MNLNSLQIHLLVPRMLRPQALRPQQFILQLGDVVGEAPSRKMAGRDEEASLAWLRRAASILASASSP